MPGRIAVKNALPVVRIEKEAVQHTPNVSVETVESIAAITSGWLLRNAPFASWLGVPWCFLHPA
jgi:hypothetical protein